MSTLGVNRCNNMFRNFVDFAQQKVNEGKEEAIATAQGQWSLGGRQMLAVTRSQTDEVHKWLRTGDECEVNDRTRALFKKAVIDMFGGESKIPKNVKKAMLLSDYGCGKPLTARRIMAIKNAIDSHVSAVPDKLNVEVKGRTITFDKWHYERIVSLMPDAERPKGLAGRKVLADQLRTLLSTRIAHGQQILRDVLAGNGAIHEASPAHVADLTLALHAAGLRNGDKLPDGSFSVSDPDGYLARWLDTSKEVYLRSSSHIKAYQRMRVDNHLNMPRGIDVPEGKNGLLGGMRTVHYGTIPDLDHLDTGGSGPKRRLFLKCETWGVIHNTISRKDIENSLSPGMRPRSARDGDWHESIRHMLSFIETRFADPARGGARKEHMSSGLKLRMETVRKMLREDGCPDAANQLVAGNPAKGGGIRMLTANINRILSENLSSLTEWGVEDILYLVSEIEKEIGDKSGEKVNRLGNEVMIDAKDLV